MPAEFNRVAIVNRGEPAMRFIRAVREFNAERGTQIRSLVFYTAPDWRARFVREADEAFALDDPASPGPAAGRTPPYLDLPRIKRALKLSNADAAWVGWGFVAERPDFADLCADLGITLIGPDSRAMRLLGDKISAKRLAERLGIPVIPWTGQAAPNLDAARAHARELGYPVVIKAAAGEGGRCAEDAEAGFAAAPGTLSLFRMPTRTGLRLDSGAAEGDAIPAEYDSMFAKLISCAASRREALAGLSVHRALQVGSLDRIIPAAELRPYLIDAIRRGMERELDRWQKASYELH